MRCIVVLLFVEKVIHQDLAVVKDRHSDVIRFLRITLLLRMSIPTRLFVNISVEYKKLASDFLITFTSLLRTIFMSTRLRRNSMVLPKRSCS